MDSKDWEVTPNMSSSDSWSVDGVAMTHMNSHWVRLQPEP